jgi:hypothetical protein
MAHFIYRKRAQNDTGYVEIEAADGDPLTAEEALVVMLKDLDSSVENILLAIQAQA